MVQARSREMTLSHLFSHKGIFVGLHATTQRRVLRDLVGLVATQMEWGRTAGLDELWSQPYLPTFGPACGVAMPHACIEGLVAPAAFLARAARPIPFESSDGELVQLVALVLAPQGDRSTLLRAMACVARRLRDDAVRRAVLAARGADAIYSVLVSEDWRPSPETLAGGFRTMAAWQV